MEGDALGDIVGLAVGCGEGAGVGGGVAPANEETRLPVASSAATASAKAFTRGGITGVLWAAATKCTDIVECRKNRL